MTAALESTKSAKYAHSQESREKTGKCIVPSGRQHWPGLRRGDVSLGNEEPRDFGEPTGSRGIRGAQLTSAT